jgi:hypothetical protein
MDILLWIFGVIVFFYVITHFAYEEDTRDWRWRK